MYKGAGHRKKCTSRLRKEYFGEVRAALTTERQIMTVGDAHAHEQAGRQRPPVPLQASPAILYLGSSTVGPASVGSNAKPVAQSHID